MTATEKITQAIDDRSTSYPLKEMLRKSLDRDPVDALNDATQLCCLLRGLVDESVDAIGFQSRAEFIETQGLTSREKGFLKEASLLLEEF